MPLQTFSFPLPETRFVKASNFIYKFKIRGGSSYSGKEEMEGTLSQELEEITRTVLGNLDSLQPFCSPHFNVFPYKKRWEGVSKVMCKHCEKKLRAYPFTLVLYLEKNTQNGKRTLEKLSPDKEAAQQIPSVSEPQRKRRKRDSPLEEAVLKDLMKDLDAESKVSVVEPHVHPHAEDEVKEHPGHVDKKATKGFDAPQHNPGVNSGDGTPGEEHPGTNEDMGEEEGNEEEENAESAPETPVKPGILTRLARHIFPFSLFFRDPREPRQTDSSFTGSSSGS